LLGGSPQRRRGCYEGGQNGDSCAGLVQRDAGARFWEIKDGSVNLGDRRGNGDLASLLVMEFALVYGNDFFVVPVRLPVGSVSTVASLVVTISGVRPHVPRALVALQTAAFRAMPTGRLNRGKSIPNDAMKIEKRHLIDAARELSEIERDAARQATGSPSRAPGAVFVRCLAGTHHRCPSLCCSCSRQPPL
jgi:hypothetical protein